MTLRKATIADLEIILHHRREMFREMGLASDASRFATADEQSRIFFGNALLQDTYHGWLIEDDGTIAAGGGVILIEYHPSPMNPLPRRAWVVNMYTETGFRKRGYARLLMETLISWTRSQGYPSLYLHASNAGRPLYETLGFSQTNEMLLKL